MVLCKRSKISGTVEVKDSNFMTIESTSPSNSKKKFYIIGTASLLLVVVGCYVAAVFATAGRTPQQTSVAGVNVGGLSVKEATVKLEQTLGAEATKPISVSVDNKKYSIDPESAGLAFDPVKTVHSFSSKTWNPVALWERLAGSVVVNPVVTVDQEKLGSTLAAISAQSDTPAVEPSIKFVSQVPELTPGKVGHVLKTDDAKQIIIHAFPKATPSMVLPFGEQDPSVSDKDAQAFLKTATADVYTPIVVNVGKQHGTISPSSLAGALTYVGKNGKMQAVIDGVALVDSLKNQISGIADTAVDASFKIVNGKPVIVPSKTGRGINPDKISQALLKVIDNPSPRSVELELGDTQPAFTTSDAEALGITEKISSFTQHFPYAPYRVQNIGQAAKYLDGTIVKPGEVFSMNNTVHERTVANGYTVGYIIGQGGQFQKDLGGGVSTATTAVWTAAFYSNMERVEQRAHSIWIPRYRAGLEATVSWGSLDMRWKNTAPTGVLIKASITKHSITVTFYGTKNFDRVDAISGPWRNVKSFGTIYSSAPTCEYQGGMNGFDITVTRVVTVGGKVVKREPFATHYSPEPRVICGKAPSASPTTSANPTPSHS